LRNLSAETIALLAAKKIGVEYSYEGVFADTTIRLWTGNRDIIIDGDTYLGNGWLVGVDGWKDTALNQVHGQTVPLSGVPLAMVAILLTQSKQTSTGTIKVLFFNGDRDFVGALETFRGNLDKVIADEAANSASLSISYESHLIKMKTKRETRMTEAAHKSKYPNDKGFDYVAQISTDRLYWGRPDSSRSR